jgi:hypothetical protein
MTSIMTTPTSSAPADDALAEKQGKAAELLLALVLLLPEEPEELLEEPEEEEELESRVSWETVPPEKGRE